MSRRPRLGPVVVSAIDVDHLLYVLRDNLRRADAFVSTAEQLVERSWGGEAHEQDADDETDHDDDSVLRRRNHVEYLVEAAKLAVRAAIYTGDQIEAELTAHRERV